MSNYHHPAAIGMCRLTGVVCPKVMRMIINRNDRIISIRRYNSTITRGARSQTTTGLFCVPEKRKEVGDEIFTGGTGCSFCGGAG